MAAQLGQFALALAWVVTAYSVLASILGIRFKHDKLIASGRNAALGAAACITTAIVCLGYLFAVSDFSIKYIAAHSNRDLPIPVVVVRFPLSLVLFECHNVCQLRRRCILISFVMDVTIMFSGFGTSVLLARTTIFVLPVMLLSNRIMMPVMPSIN